MHSGKRWLAAGALACAIGTAHAGAPTGERSLEEAFWACDYIATTRGTAAAPGDTCGAVYEQLKATKFGGSFDELVAWWQVNKPHAHARMAETVSAAPVAIVESPAPEVTSAKRSRVARVLGATRAYLSELAAAMRDD